MRYYSNTAIQTTVATVAGLTTSSTSLILASTAGYPTQFPFTIRIDRGTANEELVDVVSGLGTSLSPYVITRGIDGSTGHTHSFGATVTHAISARDFSDKPAFIDMWSWGSIYRSLMDYRYGAQQNNASFNNATVINTIINTLTAGQKLFIPNGTYYLDITSTTVISGVNTNYIIAVPKQNIVIEGESRDGVILKLKNGTGDYVSVVSDATSAGSTNMSGLTLKNLTIDQNSAGNSMADVVIASGHPFYLNPRYAVRVFSGFNGLIKNVKFINGDNINTIAMNGGSTVIGDWRIRNNLFENVGANGLAHDHSTIYGHGENFEVTDNTFKGGGNSATAAVELHGSGQRVFGNRAVDYLSFGNLTGIALTTSKNILWNYNHAKGCFLGMMIWARDYPVASPTLVGPALQDVQVVYNQFEIDYDKWSTVVGFRAGVAFDLGSTGVIQGIKVNNNQIRYKAMTGTPTTEDHSAGIMYYRTSTVTEGTADEDIEICNNTITNPLSSGIKVSPNIQVDRLKVNDNTVVNPGTGTSNSAYRVGVFMVATTTLNDPEVNNNRVVDTRGTHLVSSAVSTTFVTGTVNDGRASGNRIRCTDAVNIPVHAGSATAGAAWYMDCIMGTYAAPSGVWKAGSNILDLATGNIKKQTAVASGSTWA